MGEIGLKIRNLIWHIRVTRSLNANQMMEVHISYKLLRDTQITSQTRLC